MRQKEHYKGKKEKKINKTKQINLQEKRKEKTYKKLKEKEKDKEREEEERKPTASHPSMKGQRPQERWIGMTGNHRRRP